MAGRPTTPVRFPSGVTTDNPFGPLAMYGFRNPFLWHEYEDDFDNSVNGSVTTYTKTITSSGTIAQTAGDGGLARFTTNASTPLATDICSIQLPVASFAMAAGARAFFLTRMRAVTSANLTEWLAGLIQTTTTPFTVTDGIYFYKASGSTTNLILRHSVGSVNTDLVIPTAAYTLADNTWVEMGWFLDRYGQINAFIGSQLVGYINAAGTGTQTPAVAGSVASFTPATLVTANLNATLAVRSGTTTSKVVDWDFALWSKER